jgi:Transcriptional regulators
VNLKQLAELLGLSQTTVSRALNGYPEVSRATRERVLKAAEETGYRPNAAARRLATGRAGSIGLVMPAAPDYYADIHFAEFLSGLGEEAARQDFHFVLMPKKPGEEEDALRWLAASGSVDGVYLAYMQEKDPRIPLMHSLKMPFLIHGRSIGMNEDYPFLDVDNEAAFRDATNLLLELGHRRLALLNGPAGLDFTIRRRKGAEAAMAAKGLALDPAQVHHTAMTDEFGFRGMRQLLEQETPPTAVLCASTVLALGAIRAVNQAGLRLGRDISLIAHDDVLPLLKPEDFSVPLTTTRSSLRAAGVRIGQRLIDRIKGIETGPEQELWKAELIVRSSTGAAPR